MTPPPKNPTRPPESVLEEAGNQEIAPFAGKRALVIDDYQGIRRMLWGMLKGFGVGEIDKAADAVAAIHLLARRQYDIVLCDYHLATPRNGLNVLEEARGRGLVSPSCAWLMVTAEKTAEMVIGACEYQPDDYLIKPISELMLKTRLLRVLRRKRVFLGIESAMQKKDYPAALHECAGRLCLDPGNHDLLRLKSQLHLNLGQAGAARAIFEQVLVEREIPWARAGLGRIACLKKHWQEARTHLEILLAATPLYLEGYDLLAKALERLGDPAGAQDVLQKAISLSPNSLSRQQLLAELATRGGAYDLAEQAWRKVIELGEYSARKSPEPFVRLARLYQETDDPGAASRILAEARRRFAGSQDVLLQALVVEGKLARGTGNKHEARALLKDVRRYLHQGGFRLDPDLALDTAHLMFSLGERDEASSLLRDVIQRRHEDGDLHHRVEKLFRTVDMGEEGRQIIQHSIAEVVEINNRGVELSRKGRVGEAVALLKQASGHLPENPRILMNYSLALLLQMQQQGPDPRRLQEIRDLLDEIRKISPDLDLSPLWERLAQLR